MPEFLNLDGTMVSVEPPRFKVVFRRPAHMMVSQTGDAKNTYRGKIDVECSSSVAFAELVKALVHYPEVLGALERAATDLMTANSYDEKVAARQRIQKAYFQMTGWHLTGFVQDKPRSPGITTMVRDKVFGRLTPPELESPQEKK